MRHEVIRITMETFTRSHQNYNGNICSACLKTEKSTYFHVSKYLNDSFFFYHCVPESPKWSKMVLKLLVWIFMLSWMSIKYRQSKKKKI